jgi:hypothetical protein
MQEWRKSDWHNLRWPMPIIQAFYLQKPESTEKAPTDEGESEAAMTNAGVPDDVGTTKRLQRITIHSEYLYQELLSIASILTTCTALTLTPIVRT